MKLVYVIADLNVGGAEMFLVKLSRELSPYHSIQVISLSSKGQLAAQLQEMGVPVTALGLHPGRFSLTKFMHLVRLLRQIKPDVVHTWMYHACVLGGIAARITRTPRVVWSIHHSNLARDANKLATLLVVYIGAFLSRFIPDRIIYVADVARKIHEDIGFSSGKAVVVTNGFDIVKFRSDTELRTSVRRELGIVDEIPLVGVIARFDVQKGHAVFVKTAANLRRLVPEVRFLLAGRDVDARNTSLMRWIDAEQLGDAIFLLGHRTDVSRLMAGLDVLLLPSIGEAFPNVVGEAMASSVPCVATDVGDAAMLIGDTGFIGPPKDAAYLAELLAKVLRMPRKEREALGSRARQRIEQHFQLGIVAQRYAELYSAVWYTTA